jgi:serine/threonine-protein kinase RsbW
MTMTEKQKKEIVISSRIDNLKLIDSFVDEIFATFNFSQEQYGNVLISLHEAVTNAIFHGNKKNPDKKVFISSQLEGDCLIISVEDEGSGFDYTDLPDPTKEENREKPYGRGIYLIANLTDKYEFQNNGRKIILRFNYRHQLSRLN